jgi:O-antigen ligase
MLELTNMDFLKKYWVYILVASLPFERIPSFNASVNAHTFTIRISYIIAFVGFIAFIKIFWGLLKSRWTSPQFWLLVYLFVAFLSGIAALNVNRSFFALAATILTIGAGLIISRTAKITQMPMVYKVLSAATVVVCLFGLYQFIGDALGLSNSLTGLTPNYTRRVFGFPRIQSTGLEPLFFGNFLLIPFGLTLAKALSGRANKWTYILLLVVTATMTLTLSRGTYYAAIAGSIGLAIMLTRKQTLRSAATSLIVLLAGIGLSIGLIAAVTTLRPSEGRSGDKALKQFAKQSTTVAATTTSADSDRVVNRKLAVEAFKKRPLIGYGLGNFGTYVQTTRPGLYGPNTSRVVVNNEYLEILAETGIAGALALLGFALTLGWKVFYRLIFASAEERVWLLGLVAVAGGFAIQFNAFSTLYIMHIWVALGLLMAISQKPWQNAK